MKHRALIALLVFAGGGARADVYAYVNENGDYVVTRDVPGEKVAEYAVLTDDGDFQRLVRPRNADVPISHWRPWFLPKQPDPYDADEEVYREREGVVGIEEVEEDASRSSSDDQ